MSGLVISLGLWGFRGDLFGEERVNAGLAASFVKLRSLAVLFSSESISLLLFSCSLCSVVDV